MLRVKFKEQDRTKVHIDEAIRYAARAKVIAKHAKTALDYAVAKLMTAMAIDELDMLYDLDALSADDHEKYIAYCSKTMQEIENVSRMRRFAYEVKKDWSVI